MYKIILIISFWGMYSAFGQDLHRFHVKNTLVRERLPSGVWDEWSSFGDMNKSLDQRISINLDGKVIIWETQYKQQPKRFHNYKIVDIEQDTAYKDFGFWVLRLDVKDEKEVFTTLRIFFGNNKNYSYYVLIKGDNSFQTKSELEYVRD